MHNDELLYAVALTKIEKVGAVTAKNLISYCGSPQAVLKEKKQHLLRIPQIGEGIAQAIQDPTIFSKAEEELRFTEQEQIQVIYYQDALYRSRLNNYQDSPLILYYKGTSNLNQEKIIAVVGTRKVTEYGKKLIQQLIDGIRDLNILVVSGLAYGVDSLAHKKCVEEHIETIGILGHGLDRMYPEVNTQLAKQMQRHGGVLTEFGMNTKPDRENFPKRNRIVAGMSDAVLVIETLREGGSMITASYANQYNKDVFAVPGKTSDVYSSGCNFLIKNHQAQLIESAEDLILNMRWDVAAKSPKGIQQSLFVELDASEKQLIEILQNNNAVSIDYFYQNTEFSPSQLASVLLNLEFKGLVQLEPGKKYSLVN